MKHCATIGVLMSVMLTQSPVQASVPIVAHRGASADAPENTMAAFNLAWAQGADAIEGDFHLTADGAIVCMHDANAKRTTGVDGEIARMDRATVQSLDVGRWKDARFTGERAPLLADVVQSVPAGRGFFIEIKCGPEIVPELVRVLEPYRARWGDFRVISFDAEVIAAVKQRMPELRSFWLTSFKADAAGIKRPTAAEAIATLNRIKADGLDAKADLQHLDSAFVAALNKGGYELHVWTVDDPAVAKEAIARGARSITTNRPGDMRRGL